MYYKYVISYKSDCAYRKAVAALVVFDVTSADSFEKSQIW